MSMNQIGGKYFSALAASSNNWLGATMLTKIRRDRTALESTMALTRQMLKKPG